MNEATFPRHIFRQKLRSVTWIPIIGLLLLGVLLFWLVARLGMTLREVDHRDLVIAKAHHTTKLLLDLETGQRGYLLSRDEAFLEPYQSALGQVDKSVDQLDQLMAAVLSPAPELFRLRQELGYWKDYAREVIEKKDVSTVAKGEGKRKMDLMRSLLDDLTRREQLLREEAQREARGFTRLVLGLTVGLALLMGLILSLMIRQQVKSLNRAYSEVLGDAQRAEEQNRALVNGIQDHAIILLDPEGQILSWNTGAERLYGIVAADAIGKNHALLFRPENVAADAPAQSLARAIRDGKSSEEVWRMKKDGTIFRADVVLTALQDDEGKPRGFSCIIRDITRRHQAERERALLISRLREAVRSRDEFLSLVSQELKTPLTGMTQQVQSVLRGKNGLVQIPPVSHYISMHRGYRKQLDRVNRLVEDMLDLARIHSGQLVMDPKPVELSTLVNDVLRHLSDEFSQAGSPLHLEADPGVVGEWDSFRVEQVLLNLLSNAFRFGNGKPIQVRVKKEERRALISVQDHGPGISRDQQAKIFEKFHRASSSDQIGGLGLGLYIAKEIAERHGGKIHLESEPGQGSVFTLELPIPGSAPTPGPTQGHGPSVSSTV